MILRCFGGRLLTNLVDGLFCYLLPRGEDFTDHFNRAVAARRQASLMRQMHWIGEQLIE